MTLSRTELRNWLKLMGGMRTLLDALDRGLRAEAGMSHDDYAMMSRLYREPGRTMRMSDLAKEARFSPSRLSHAVTRLEEEGWIRRARGSTDRRVVEVALTDAGADQIEAVTPAHLAQVKRLVFENLGADLVRDTAEAMDRIRRAAIADH